MTYYIGESCDSVIKQLKSLQLPGEVQAFIRMYLQTWGEQSDHIYETLNLEFDQNDFRKPSFH